MALQPNKTTGKAIADVKGLYFLKHVDGEEPVILQNLDSENWFPVLSLKGTVTASQDAPSIEKILVDQFDAPIGMTTEPGDFNFEVQLPGLAKADIAKWLGDDLHETGESINNLEVLGFNLDGRTIETSILIQTGTGACIIFSRAQVVLTFSKEDKVFLFKATGQVLAPANEANDMIYIATEKFVAVSGVTLNKSTLSLVKDAEETLVATVAPANASNKAVVWSSSDETKATVDQTGKVTAIAAGSNIKIKAESAVDGTKYAECTLTVTNS